ncbi:hypothetical protein AJ85_13980 [Alkalihalobacillus alcalophilus ATCC 27647 = CGMCC 1.3604]|uniref:DUF4303 domain-containing protein n=1 Tax=Alkalihalobacillus alcalophilus ATCC 27647 = CGMCC 1.3604 TaxID=1218173 RepID=A0A094WF62_ALKAL|nr:hypothetical protein [Alkalihalobacillus alcalophilus]KGA96394.1 hypothetical protein BALCAV_0216485 [Alkalihalobacillus alcalophilus ATCC 27647 = CGMCC 1.3604]MED1563220.1 hypothetical protein [Alkalihalobacillus alcalophilus]THG89999.1 hypothetical protein AJ85_13980 [Alkalihalobacillus alcalophilus ATCC 27647 = CGMCC 1.3604]
MFTVDQYIEKVRTHLQEHTELLTRQLKRVNGYLFSADVDLIEFVPSIEPTRYEISIMMFSMNNENNEVFEEDVADEGFAGSEELLSEVHYFQLKDSDRETFEQFYEKHGEEIEEKEYRVFAEWFLACFEQAGSCQVNKRAYFTGHDASSSFDLKKKKWIDEQGRWNQS